MTQSLTTIALAAGAAGLLITAAPPAAGSAAAAATAPRAGIITTIAGGPGGPGAGRTIAVAGPCGVTSAGRNLYVTDWPDGLLRRLGESNDALSIVATGLSNPCAMTTDPAGNLVYASAGSSQLRVIAARNGTFYGRGMRAGRSYVIGGSSFTSPDAVAADRHGNLLVSSQTTYESDYGNVPGTAVVFVLAGARGKFYGQSMVPGHVYPLAGQQCPGVSSYGCQAGLTGDGGPALAATFGPEIWGLTTDRYGNVVISDNGDGRIRVAAERSGIFYGARMIAGDIYTIAGGGPSHGLGDGGPARLATLSSPKGVVFDRDGNLVVSDSDNIRPTVGAPARDRIRVIAEHSGRFYGRRMVAGDVYTIAGGGTGAAGNGGAPLRAGLYRAAGLGLDRAGNLIIADQGQDKLLVLPASTGQFYGRRLTADRLYTIAGTGYASYSGNGGLAARAELAPSGGPGGLTTSQAGNVVIADSGNNRVRVVAARDGVFYGQRMIARHIYTVAGTGVGGFTGDNGPGTRAELADPSSVAVDKAGNILVSDTNNDRVRVIANRTGRFYNRHMIAGHIYYLAGGGFSGSDDGIPVTKASLAPRGLAVDHNGNVVVSSFGGTAVLAEQAGTFYGQHMKAGYVYGTGPDLASSAVAVDHAGNVVGVSLGAKSSQIAVLAVTAGTFYGIRMLAGRVYSLAPAATFKVLSAVAVDAAGNLLLTDSESNLVEVLAERSGTFYGVRMRAGHVYTVAGGGHRGLGDGGRATRAELSGPSGVAPYGRDLLVLDGGNGRVREVTG
jgi:hypothetical protein